MMIPDPLVFRMEQARRMVEDLENSNQEQKEFLRIGIKLLLDSCAFSFEEDDPTELETPAPHPSKIN